MNIILLLILLVPAIKAQRLWSYNEDDLYGPEKWHYLFPQCQGQRQSPIPFYKEQISVNPRLANIDLINYDREIPADTLFIKNNGHTVFVHVGNRSDIRIQGGGLPTWYKLDGFHFHWGAADTKGSEHVVGDTSAYPMAAHFVHTKEGMPFREALKLSDGLAVLGVIYELVALQSSKVKELDKIVDHLIRVRFENDNASLNDPLTLRKFLPSNTDNYFRYFGSLTTPPCAESVIWSVFVNTANVTRAQLHAFRSLYRSSRIMNKMTEIRHNYRPMQAVNRRKIQIRFLVQDLPPESSKNIKEALRAMKLLKIFKYALQRVLE